MKVFSSRPDTVFFIGRKVDVKMSMSPARVSTAASSDSPTVAMGGCVKTADATCTPRQGSAARFNWTACKAPLSSHRRESLTGRLKEFPAFACSKSHPGTIEKLSKALPVLSLNALVQLHSRGVHVPLKVSGGQSVAAVASVANDADAMCLPFSLWGDSK